MQRNTNRGSETLPACQLIVLFNDVDALHVQWLTEQEQPPTDITLSTMHLLWEHTR
jgi:hypothetical protein